MSKVIIVAEQSEAELQEYFRGKGICRETVGFPSDGFKLLLDELKALGIYPRLAITDKV